MVIRNHFYTSHINENARVDFSVMSDASYKRLCESCEEELGAMKGSVAATLIDTEGPVKVIIPESTIRKYLEDKIGEYNVFGFLAHEAWHVTAHLINICPESKMLSQEHIAYSVGDISQKLMTKFDWAVKKISTPGS